MYEPKKEIIIKYKDSLNHSMTNILNNNKHKYEILLNKLDLLSPLNILSKGYSLVTCEGNIINDSSKVSIGDNLDIRLSKGELKVEVKEKKDGK
jgi:exodeoxyribonuclease VII large subunit